VCLLVVGESGTAKMSALLGDPADPGRPGLLKQAAEELMGASYGSGGKFGVSEANFTATFWEAANEVGCTARTHHGCTECKERTRVLAIHNRTAVGEMSSTLCLSLPLGRFELVHHCWVEHCETCR
jgi:hypothetical protein